MAATIEEIIKICTMEHSLNVTPKNMPQYIGFLGRRIKKHKGFKKADETAGVAYANLLADELYIFSILTRQTEVTLDSNNGKKSLMDTFEKLRSLKQKNNDYFMWDDYHLYNIFRRRNRAREKYLELNLPSYRQVIDEVGKDKEVRKIWKKKIEYYVHVTSIKSRRYPEAKKSK